MLIEVSKVEGEENKKEYKVTPKVSVQENKAVTVDVSEYTEPVEILPPEGKVAMEKVTLTLDNIPSGSAYYQYIDLDNHYQIISKQELVFSTEGPIVADIICTFAISGFLQISDSDFVSTQITFYNGGCGSRFCRFEWNGKQVDYFSFYNTPLPQPEP